MKVIWKAGLCFIIFLLSGLVITGSGGILLHLHTCLSHQSLYVSIFEFHGVCEHSGNCCHRSQIDSCCSGCCSLKADFTDKLMIQPQCCKNDAMILITGEYIPTEFNKMLTLLTEDCLLTDYRVNQSLKYWTGIEPIKIFFWKTFKNYLTTPAFLRVFLI